MAYLQSGPVASILDTFRPGASRQLHDLFSSIVDEGAAKPDQEKTGVQSAQGKKAADTRRGNPFPALKQ